MQDINNITTNDCALKLVDIVKVYGDGENAVTALKGINLSFRKNEFVSILGPSGCGKTTLLNIIGGLDRYTSGDLIIDGKSTKDYKDREWDAYRNNSIGFVFQTYNLIPHQTVLGNVEIALELSGVKKQERKRKAIEMLERVGLKKHIHKKPNQLSGGQMQRVAIARALINNPDIILADEPTGALDTETSVQIMELLKEVAKDKLVIMVTHNPELAKKYSTRIINLLDGEKVGDSNNYEAEIKKNNKTNRKPKMGFKTAFALSLKNLISKRTRTVLTSVAGSIGIIGVALVLALSNGFSAYMDRMQTDSLATYPLTISESSVDLSTFSEIDQPSGIQKYPELDNVFVKKAFDKLTGMLKSNKLSDSSVLNAINGIDSEDVYSIQYQYGFDMNEYMATYISVNSTELELDGTPKLMAIDTLVKMIEKQYDSQLQSAMGFSSSFVRQYIPTIQEMPNSPQLLKEQYDILKAKDGVSFDNLAENQMFLVVDEYNELSDISLALLGYLSVNIEKDGETTNITFEEKSSFTYDDVIGKEVYYLTNDDIYVKQTGMWTKKELAPNDDQKLEIVGVIRHKENIQGILEVGFAYTSALTEKVKSENVNSQIANECRGNSISFNYTDYIFVNGGVVSLRSLGGVGTPSMVNIYAKNFDSKERVKNYLDNYNENQTDESLQITYSDMMSMLFSSLTTMVDAVTYVLVAFTSISLVVSSVMIGIITYISVVERTKEIGVLRSLGASKKEISNVFNAETFLIGLFAGTFGVVVTYLMCIPINIIIGGAVENIGRIAVLNPLTAIVLIVISFILTLIAGLIPSRIAAKKDPVVALRTE